MSNSYIILQYRLIEDREYGFLFRRFREVCVRIVQNV